MDTIIYLKMDKGQGQEPAELPVFHISVLGERELMAFFAASLQFTKAQRRQIQGMWEGMQFVCVNIPRDIDTRYVFWPAELSSLLKPFFGYSTSIETVWDLSVERWIRENKCRERLEAVWPYEVYRDYHREAYAHILLCRGVGRLPEGMVPFYVLGYETFVPRVLSSYIKKMKSLTFIISGTPEEHLQDYLEELYEEEGLAANLQLIEGGAGYAKLRLECSLDAVVLDLTGEEKVAPLRGAKEMVWIDMDAVEGKKRKISAKCGETVYFSMKEEWRSLDTVSKNGYNT